MTKSLKISATNLFLLQIVYFIFELNILFYLKLLWEKTFFKQLHFLTLKLNFWSNEISEHNRYTQM